MAVILVTGGAGYVGSHACKALAAAGHEPVCFDSYRTGWREAVRYGPAVEGNLLDAASVREAIARFAPAAVMHFAALSLVGESVRDPGLYWRANLTGALNLLEAMREEGVGALVFSSTAAVYGACDAALIPEDAPLRPDSPYGSCKLAIERLIADFERFHGLRAGVFRYFNVAGADPEGEIGEDHRPETHLIPIMLEAALGRRPEIVVYGDDYPTEDGTCVRDYVHASDLARAHVLGVERLLAGGEGFTANLGAGRGLSVREVIERAGEVVGRPVPHRVGPRRPGDPARLVCDPSRARQILGWRAERSDIDAILRDAWAWMRRGGYGA
ncbi:UDP-glucose 4-epimerase GalE [Rubrimonas cliftonensis]|uniref:UDP-glucose 4-epimerase n=1 Tax=Rubrimonas cliftonensis TaxID=89524 RepID=A0A1H4CW44_9RHOB|nr:UDP-galactose 4-epimerase [Rubrimonas cliftonensis]